MCGWSSEARNWRLGEEHLSDVLRLRDHLAVRHLDGDVAVHSSSASRGRRRRSRLRRPSPSMRYPRSSLPMGRSGLDRVDPMRERYALGQTRARRRRWRTVDTPRPHFRHGPSHTCRGSDPMGQTPSQPIPSQPAATWRPAASRARPVSRVMEDRLRRHHGGARPLPREEVAAGVEVAVPLRKVPAPPGDADQLVACCAPDLDRPQRDVVAVDLIRLDQGRSRKGYPGSGRARSPLAD